MVAGRLTCSRFREDDLSELIKSIATKVSAPGKSVPRHIIFIPWNYFNQHFDTSVVQVLVAKRLVHGCGDDLIGAAGCFSLRVVLFHLVSLFMGIDFVFVLRSIGLWAWTCCNLPF